jgi:hypothetical protein
MSDHLLEMWTIYDHPRDMPEKYVARLHVIDKGGSRPTDKVIVADNLDAIREIMESHGLTRLKRYDDDDPVIVEVWL